METVNVFGGTGFIGGTYCKKYSNKVVIQERDNNTPKTSNILYFISTTDNYNVFGDATLDIKTNLLKLVEVLKECKEGSTFNYISSWFVYGNCPLPASEDAYCRPRGFYSITKKCAEDLLISYCKTFNINYRILRLSNIIGKDDRGAGVKKNALQYLLAKLKNNEPISIYDNGQFFRDYLHVEDACCAIDKCVVQAPLNEIINIGSGIKYNFYELIMYAKNYLNSTSIIESRLPSKFHNTVQVKDMVLDITKLKKYTNFTQKYNIETSIKEILCNMQ